MGEPAGPITRGWSAFSTHASKLGGLLGLLVAVAGLYIAWRQWRDDAPAQATVTIARFASGEYIDAVLCSATRGDTDNPFATPSATFRPPTTTYDVSYLTDLSVTLVNRGDQGTSLLNVHVEADGLTAGRSWTIRAFETDSTPRDPLLSWVTALESGKRAPVMAAITAGGSISRFFVASSSETFATAAAATAAFQRRDAGRLTWIFELSDGSVVRQTEAMKKRSGLADGGTACYPSLRDP